MGDVNNPKHVALQDNEVHEIRDTDIQICIHAAAGDVALEI